jgi:hypothetical protein
MAYNLYRTIYDGEPAKAAIEPNAALASGH